MNAITITYLNCNGTLQTLSYASNITGLMMVRDAMISLKSRLELKDVSQVKVNYNNADFR